ncbi:hypothetical protein UFOVP860_51 [uncultured Caudovirales phage]|uniref:Uncharacterized protein n=1 Tax=uncultured Caudovirales phage TaxID=2100421 RepID=A0A6J5P9L5_9CAUD|nr:hypothetical protein UFOVP860_51 [uncultured Caudovirales phage]CAB4195827.1 hypothetical protein UFOVP1293_60 [uncultured Caudovirales phage]CAB4222601.1 hypothetical protein UFOVP1644_78 [uncultured Caudovirales phage]
MAVNPIIAEVLRDFGLARRPIPWCVMPASKNDRRCGTCVHWRPDKKRDDKMDRHYGTCRAPLPKDIPASFDRSIGDRWKTAHSSGDKCIPWKAGGENGALK